MTDTRSIAAQRWRAVEALNTARGLTGAARRVGIELLTTMDAKTLACFPSELRIAAKVGMSMRAVQKAKAELREHGIVFWTNKGGPRHVSRYTFNWDRLDAIATDMQERARDQMLAGGEPEPNSAHRTVVYPERECVIKPEPQCGIETGIETSKPALLDSKPARQFVSNTNPSSSELTQLSYPAESTQPIVGNSESAEQARSSSSVALDGASSSERSAKPSEENLNNEGGERSGHSEPTALPKALEGAQPKHHASLRRPTRAEAEVALKPKRKSTTEWILSKFDRQTFFRYAARATAENEAELQDALDNGEGGLAKFIVENVINGEFPQ